MCDTLPLLPIKISAEAVLVESIHTHSLDGFVGTEQISNHRKWNAQDESNYFQTISCEIPPSSVRESSRARRVGVRWAPVTAHGSYKAV